MQQGGFGALFGHAVTEGNVCKTMLAELSIKNFAIIESLSLSFEKGLTVITGETGAGKSIIIDAIQLLAGGRGSIDFVRYGAKKAELEGLFFVEEDHPVLDKLQQFGIEASEGTIVLQREIFQSGKSVCRINHKLVTTAVLKEIGEMLIDVHGQNEHHHLLLPDNQLTMLDEFGRDSIETVLETYRKRYREYQQLKEELVELSENEQQTAQRLDLIQYQLNEITEAALSPGEEETLLEERTKLANFEKLHEAMSAAYDALYGEQKGLDWIGRAMHVLSDVSELDQSLQDIHESVSNSYYMMEEAVFRLRQQLEQLEFDPEKLVSIEARLHEIQKLKRKYGHSIEEILDYAAGIEKERDKLLNREQHLEQLEKQMQETVKDLFHQATELRKVRERVSSLLTDLVHQELQTLHMDKTVFSINHSPYKAHPEKDPVVQGNPVRFTKDGIDQIEFFIATNPGEPLKPLAKIASGGELSRIMLALKLIFTDRRREMTMIFDEVDTGVSGRVAQAMAEKIQRLSRSQQVFCITHLPQIAAMADTHFYILKETTDENRTVTKVERLSETEKVKEIGRMISGAEVTNLTKQHAKELIELASKMKTTI
mgnify:CR=1 FL=1